MRVVHKAKCYKLDCPRCMSVLEFTLDDIVACTYDLTDAGKIICPVCNNPIVVRKYNNFGSPHSGTRMADNVSVDFEPAEGACADTTEVDNGK